MTAPNKLEREQCWTSRDSYWQCLEDNKEDTTKCQKERETFESSCTKTWLKYFDRRRDYLKYKELLERQGFEPITADKSKATPT